jgi:hypothetical protein
MDLLDLFGGSWLIEKSRLLAMQQIAVELLTDKGRIEKLAANFTPDPDPGDPDDFLLKDGIAVIPVTGILRKRMSSWAYIFGFGRPDTKRLPRWLLRPKDLYRGIFSNGHRVRSSAGSSGSFHGKGQPHRRRDRLFRVPGAGEPALLLGKPGARLCAESSFPAP